MSPSISIIVCAHNSEKTIEKCLQSLIAQKDIDTEIIVVDDGSTDATVKKCQKYRCDSKIKLLSIPRGGPSLARNCGMDVATGDFIGFVDSDDYVENTMYSELYVAAMEAKADIVICEFVRESPDGKRIYTGDCKLPAEFPDLLDDQQICTIYLPQILVGNNSLHTPIFGGVWRCLYRRNHLLSIGAKFNQHLKFGEDLHFNFSVLSKASCMKICRKQLYHYVQWPNSLGSAIKEDTSENYLRLFRELKSLIARENLEKCQIPYVIWVNRFSTYLVVEVLRKLGGACSKKTVLTIQKDQTVRECASQYSTGTLPLKKWIVLQLIRMRMIVLLYYMRGLL